MTEPVVNHTYAKQKKKRKIKKHTGHLKHDLAFVILILLAYRLIASIVYLTHRNSRSLHIFKKKHLKIRKNYDLKITKFKQEL